MNKKIIPCILVVSLLFSIGCSSTHSITTEQLEAKPNEELKAELEQRDITVFTKEDVEYEFLKGNYRIQSDTLIGFGAQRIGGKDERFHGSIALASVGRITSDNVGAGAIEGAIIGAVLVGVPIGLLGASLSTGHSGSGNYEWEFLAGSVAVAGVVGAGVGALIGHTEEYIFQSKNSDSQKEK